MSKDTPMEERKDSVREKKAVDVIGAMDRQVHNDIREFIENRKESVDITRWVCAAEGELAIEDILPKDENTDRINPIKVGLYDVTDLYLEVWKWHPTVNDMIINHVDNMDEMNEKDKEKSILKIVRKTSSIINRSRILRQAIDNGSIEVFSSPSEVSDLERMDIFRDAAGHIISGSAPRTKYDTMYNQEINYMEEEEKRLVDRKNPRIKNQGTTSRDSGLLGR